MNTTKILTASVLASLFSVSAFAADVEVTITGATAFRSAAHEGIYNYLQNQTGVTTVNAAYCFDEDTGTPPSTVSGSDRSIFTASGNGTSYLIRCSWSGSLGGINSLITGVPVEVIDETQVTPTAITTYPNGGNGFNYAANLMTSAVADYAFSDVSKDSAFEESASDLALLTETQVGVIPFQFVANEGFPVTDPNMTDQIFEAMWSTGSVPMSMFTGDSNDSGTTVYATGRYSASGTRANTLAETRYGIATPVTQWKLEEVDLIPDPNNEFDHVDINTTVLFDDPDTPAPFDFNYGESSSSTLRRKLQLPSDPSGDYLGAPFFAIGYIDAKDVAAVVAGGAVALTYNGEEPFAGAGNLDPVKNGSYTFWGTEVLVWKTPGAKVPANFVNDFVGAVQNNLDTAKFVPLGDMNVSRATDGGLVSPL